MNTPEKRNFIHYELWILVFGGAFQRANIYNVDVDEAKRYKFRNELRQYVSKKIIPQYKNAVSEKAHMKNLREIVVFSEKYTSILNHGKLNLGVSQKLLNLALKYHWCLGEISTPPHFPVDRIIQKKINRKSIVNWTSLNDVNEYLSIIEDAKSKLIEKQSLAEWELNNFNRR